MFNTWQLYVGLHGLMYGLLGVACIWCVVEAVWASVKKTE